MLNVSIRFARVTKTAKSARLKRRTNKNGGLPLGSQSVHVSTCKMSRFLMVWKTLTFQGAWCDWKSRAAYAQCFAPWQQETIEIMRCNLSSRTLVIKFNRSHVNFGRATTSQSLLLLLARATYMYGAILHAHPVRGESHNQRNTTGEVATSRTCNRYHSRVPSYSVDVPHETFVGSDVGDSDVWQSECLAFVRQDRFAGQPGPGSAPVNGDTRPGTDGASVRWKNKSLQNPRLIGRFH